MDDPFAFVDTALKFMIVVLAIGILVAGAVFTLVATGVIAR